MTPDLKNLEQRVDRERRKREREILILLLLFFTQARRHAGAAVRVGADPFVAISDVLLGNPTLSLPGLPGALSEQLAAAEAAGFHRTRLVVGDTSSQPSQTDTSRSQAGLYVAQMLATLHRKLAESLRDASGHGGALQAILGAFRDGGYIDGKPAGWLLQTIAVTLTGKAYMSGYMRGWSGLHIYGFEHVSVLDDRTSEICNDHEGTRLPADDPFWAWNSPPLHWNCRSVLKPIFEPFIPTQHPTVQPQQGFGAWLWGAYGQSMAA